MNSNEISISVPHWKTVVVTDYKEKNMERSW